MPSTENVIRCPVLLAGLDVMKFILPGMYPGSNDNQNENLYNKRTFPHKMPCRDGCAHEGDLRFLNKVHRGDGPDVNKICTRSFCFFFAEPEVEL